MLHTQFPSLGAVPAHAVSELRGYGVDDEDIAFAWATQQAQRRAGAPVLPLRTICGVEARSVPSNSVLGPIAGELIGTKPTTRRKSGGRHITHARVRAGSVQTGCATEADFVRPLSASALKTMRQACHRAFERARELAVARRAGQELTPDELRLSAFSKSCRDMMLGILDDLHYRKGWCFPSYETLMEWAGTQRRMVKYALDRLHEIGMIEWIRRFNYTTDKQRGARSEQTSNLYRAHLPQWLAKMIGLAAPVPDDEQHRRDQALEDHASMLARVGKNERRRMMPADPGIRAKLVNAAVRVWRRDLDASVSRECNDCTEPLPISYNKREKELPWSGNTPALTGQ